MNDRPEEDDVPLLDYWRVIRKRQRMITGLVCAAVLLAMVVSLLQPKVYESTTTILPQIDSKEGMGLGSLLALSGSGGTGAGALAQGLGITLPGIPATPTDIFVAMLKSRVMADEVIKQFDLMKVYEAKTRQDARKALESDTKIMVSKEKVIKVTVEARSPQLASDIANFYVANLDRLNRTLNVTKSGQNRVFVEKRLADTKVNLVNAEEALREFQTENKAVHLEAQGRAAIEAAAMIQAEISAAEVQLEVMESYLTPENPDVVRMRSNVGELKKQLVLLETGKGGKGQLPGDRMHPAFITVPSLVLEYARMLRAVKVQEALYTMLTSQYEQAKIAEARDTPSVQVLDPGVPAERKSKPWVTLNMLTAGALALFLGMFLAFFLDYLERMKRKLNERRSSENAVPSSSTDIRPVRVEEEANRAATRRNLSW